MTKIAVIIPAFNEVHSIGKVVAAIPNTVYKIVVVDNASTDATAQVAESHGAVVLHEKQKGYGYACLKGIAHLQEDPPEIVVFLDGDYSDYPEQLTEIIRPIVSDNIDFVNNTVLLWQVRFYDVNTVFFGDNFL